MTESGRPVPYRATLVAVDRQLLARVPPERVEGLRSALGAHAEIKSADIAAGAGRPRSPRQFRRFRPIFPVRNLAGSLVGYSSLGFCTIAYDDGDDYGFADREGVGIQLAFDPHLDHDPTHHLASTYLYVRDADALYEQWSRPGIGGLTQQVQETSYWPREGSHVEPDGNVIRLGSPMES